MQKPYPKAAKTGDKRHRKHASAAKKGTAFQAKARQTPGFCNREQRINCTPEQTPDQRLSRNAPMRAARISCPLSLGCNPSGTKFSLIAGTAGCSPLTDHRSSTGSE